MRNLRTLRNLPLLLITLSIIGLLIPTLCLAQNAPEAPEIRAVFGMTPEEIERLHDAPKAAQADIYPAEFKDYKVFFEYRFTSNALTQINITPRARADAKVYEESMLAIVAQLTTYYEKTPEKGEAEGNTLYVWKLKKTIVVMKWNTKTWQLIFRPKEERT